MAKPHKPDDPVAVEVVLSEGWLTRDVARAKARLAEWKSEGLTGKSEGLAVIRKCGTCRWRADNRQCMWPLIGRMPQWVKLVFRQLPPKKPSNYGTKCNAWEPKE